MDIMTIITTPQLILPERAEADTDIFFNTLFLVAAAGGQITRQENQSHLIKFRAIK